MSNTKAGYKTLKEIVKRVLIEIGETSNRRYALCKGYGVDFLRDYYLDSGSDVVTEKLTLDSLKRAKIPCDYIDYVKIGVQIGDHIKSYLRDENLATTFDKNGCELVPNQSTADVTAKERSGYYYGSHYFHNYVNQYGEHLGGFYGVGNGRIRGGFTIKDGYIFLASHVAEDTEIYLEYISSKMIYGVDTCLPIIAEQACKDYIKWQLKLDDDQAPMNQKQLAGVRYANSMKQVSKRVHKLTAGDIIHIMRDNFKLAPKT